MLVFAIRRRARSYLANKFALILWSSSSWPVRCWCVVKCVVVSVCFLDSLVGDCIVVVFTATKHVLLKQVNYVCGKPLSAIMYVCTLSTVSPPYDPLYLEQLILLSIHISALSQC